MIEQEAADRPAPLHRFKRKVSLIKSAAELWRSRELVRTLAERELRARYSQAVLGFAWALLTPLALMLVFTVFFNRVAKVDTGGAPYALYAYLGLLPWTFFSSSVSLGGQSLIANLSLLNKVYCPREVFPLASVLVAGLDMVISTAVLVVLFVVYRTAPKSTAVWIVPLLLVQLAFTMGVALIISSIVIYLRDLRHVLPIALQLGLFATPVAYGIDVVPRSARPLYSLLNPLAPVIDGYRRAILLGKGPSWGLVGLGAITATAALAGGYLAFKRLEPGMADVA